MSRSVFRSILEIGFFIEFYVFPDLAIWAGYARRQEKNALTFEFERERIDNDKYIERHGLLEGSILVAPKNLSALEAYAKAYPGVAFSRLDVASWTGLFFPRLSTEAYPACRDILPASQGAIKLLFALLPPSPTDSILRALSLSPFRLKKKNPVSFFSGKNVVYLGFEKEMGPYFASLLRDIPILSASWGPASFGKGAGLSYRPLKELYRLLSPKAILELGLVPYEAYVEGLRREKGVC